MVLCISRSPPEWLSYLSEGGKHNYSAKRVRTSTITVASCGTSEKCHTHKLRQLEADTVYVTSIHDMHGTHRRIINVNSQCTDEVFQPFGSYGVNLVNEHN